MNRSLVEGDTEISYKIYPNTESGVLPEGVTATFNPERVVLKINQTAYSKLILSVNRTAKVGTYSLSVFPYKSSTPESGFDVETQYNNINLTIG